METALTAQELGLRLAIAPVDKPANRASLAGMPGVHDHNLAAESLSLVFKKALELGEAPRVEPPFGFAARGFNTRTDVGEILNHDSGAGLNVMQDRGRDNVIAIPSEALFTPSEASNVSPGTLRTVGLQCTSKSKGALDNFFHVPVAMKAIVRGHSGASDAQVHADCLATGDEFNVGKFDDDMQKEPTFTDNQVGGRHGIADGILRIFRQLEGYLHPAVRGSHTDQPSIPVELAGMQIIAGWAESGLWTPSSQPLLCSSDCRFHSPGSLLPGLDMQVGDQKWQSRFTVAVGQTVQCIGIAIALLPACLAHDVERLGKLPHCFS